MHEAPFIMVSQSQKIQHLYNRAAFGLSITAVEKKKKLRKEQNALLTGSVEELPLDVFTENPYLALGAEFRKSREARAKANKDFQEAVRENRKKIRPLNVQWMERMSRKDCVLREKITFFWHDHFAVRSNNGYHVQLHNNLLRKHALGKYGDLLLAVAKDPAMLEFLNNQQNNKRKPNENFARELLELYTLGRGHYTERDVKNAARAFTGWKRDRFSCEFLFLARQHDDSPKEFMSKSGNFNGEDIIDIILSDKQTATYLAGKLFRYYVADRPDEEIISLMANRLFETDYDIGDLLSFVFKSDWFYEDRFFNNKIKSPIELINGIGSHFGLVYRRPEALVYLQNSLGQRLFFPPGVNGWPVGREWIDSTSLVNRMRLTKVLADKAELGIRVRDDLDNNTATAGLGGKLLLTGEMNWLAIEGAIGHMSDEQMIDALSELLVNGRLMTKTRKLLLSGLARQQEDRIRWLALSIAGLPEYQLA